PPDSRRAKESRLLEHWPAPCCERGSPAKRATATGRSTSPQGIDGCPFAAQSRARLTLQPDRQAGAEEVLLQRLLGARSARTHIACCFPISPRTRVAAARNRYDPVD